MATVKVKRVPRADQDVYDALVASWRAAWVDGTGDKSTAVSNFSFLSETGRWLVDFGPAGRRDLMFPENAKEWTSAELRLRLGLTAKVVKRPGKAEVLAAARRLAAMVPEVPEDIAAILEAA